MAKFNKKLQAFELRRKGISIIEIAKILGVAKSTVCLWCQTITLTPDQKNILKQNTIRAGMAGRMKGAEMNRRKREDAIKLASRDARNLIQKISQRDLFMIGLALYWAEGSKTRGSRLSFVNSDPIMLRLIMAWFADVFRVNKDDFILRIAINESHRPREQIVLKYWSRYLEIPEDQFRKTSFIKTKQAKVYENYDNYFGTVAIRMKRSNFLWYKILQCIELIKKPT